MIYAKVDNKSREQLAAELKKASDAKWYQRLKIIELSSTGQTVPQLAKMFNLCQQTIRDYIKRYNTGGVSGLRRENSFGRPPKVDWTRSQWEQLLKRSPCSFPSLNTAARNWNQLLLVEYFRIEQSIEITQSALSMIFKRLKIKFNRGKLKVTSGDPLYTVKRERVETLKKKSRRQFD